MAQDMHGSSVFRDRRYQERASHLGRISDVVFNSTDVGDFIAQVNCDRKKRHPLIEGRLGDPTMYSGLRSYEGYHRHLKRFINFHEPSEYDGYDLDGDPALKARLRTGRWHSQNYLPVPQYVEVYMTPGVAGALRLVSEALLLPPNYLHPSLERLDDLMGSLCEETVSHNQRQTLISFLLSLRERIVPDNVVVPLWTYPSHLAEVFRCHSDVNLCNIRKDGQVDVEHLKQTIDSNTRAIIFATVGNPLSVAMEPEIFDSILRVVRGKMEQYNHPIVVLADIIYEHYRRDQAKRIDPIQKELALQTGVPIIEMSSFSKMMAIPGQRVGYVRILWDPNIFPDVRHDFHKTLKFLYGPQLCPVARLIQRALGNLYQDVNRRSPVEEKLAPVAAVLTALQELTDMKGHGDRNILFSQDEIDSRLKELGVPDGYLSSHKGASRVRKLSNKVLAGYNVDINSPKVRELCKVLSDAGIVDIIEREGMDGEAVFFYKLKEEIPKISRDPETGQLQLYGISSDERWVKLAARCGLPTEDALYSQHKKTMKETVFERVLYFATELDKMRSEGVGVYLHPAYYDESGNLDPNRFNAFYVLWGFEKLRKYSPQISQAAQVASKCVENDLPIIANTPAELFVPFEMRDDSTSYLRNVALQTKKKMDEMFRIIRIIARELESKR